MSSFQGVGIEEFHCIQRCPYFKGLESRSSTVYRGVFILGGWNRGVLLRGVLILRGLECIQMCRRDGIEGFHCIQRCPHIKRAGTKGFH